MTSADRSMILTVLATGLKPDQAIAIREEMEERAWLFREVKRLEGELEVSRSIARGYHVDLATAKLESKGWYERWKEANAALKVERSTRTVNFPDVTPDVTVNLVSSEYHDRVSKEPGIVEVYRPGDQLFNYDETTFLAGTFGVMIVRDGKIVAKVVCGMS